MPTPSRITWHPPLDKIQGRVSEIDLDEPISVGELLMRLCEQKPDLQKLVRLGPNDTHARGLIILQRGTLLKLADKLEPGDELEIMAMIEGG